MFSKIPVEKEIETLPDKMSPKKRNIKLKKEVYVEETTSKKPRDTRIVSRNEVKIVRERKKRDIGNKESGINRDTNKLEKEKIKKTVKSDGKIKTKIAKQEGIEVSEEEIEAEYNSIAAQYRMDVEKVKEYIDAASISYDVRLRKALDVIKAASKKKEKDA